MVDEFQFNCIINGFTLIVILLMAYIYIPVAASVVADGVLLFFST